MNDPLFERVVERVGDLLYHLDRSPNRKNTELINEVKDVNAFEILQRDVEISVGFACFVDTYNVRVVQL